MTLDLIASPDIGYLKSMPIEFALTQTRFWPSHRQPCCMDIYRL